MTEIILLVILLAGIAIILYDRFRPKETAPDQSIIMIQQQLDALRGQVSERLDNNAAVMQKSSSSLNERLDNAARVISDVHRELGKVHTTVEAVKDIKDILKAPKLRGGFGEFFLEDLLSQMLPAKHVTAQYEFKNREKVDAVIHLGERLVPVDSKFPLENFQKAVGLENDTERRQAQSQFIRDVRKHIDAVAKYIRPDEGTYDFALMYIPSENIYYEIAVKNEWGKEDRPILNEAVAKKVIPVSPNTLYTYLVTVVMGLRGMAVGKRAQYVIGQIGRLQKEFSVFNDEFSKLGRQIEMAKSTFDRADKKAGQINDKFNQVASVDSDADTIESGPTIPTLPN